MDTKLRVGISACLLGEPVRYDGGHKLDHYLRDTLGRYVDWVAVCPEVESGLPVPREAMRLAGDKDAPRLVTVRTGIDHTELMGAWAASKLLRLGREDLCGFVFKSRSPSSGMRGVKVYGPSGIPSRSGVGIFARAFMEQFPLLPVEDEDRLRDADHRENFIERIFVYRRWRQGIGSGRNRKDIVAFHTEHKYLILSHSTKHYTELGRFVAHAREYRPEELRHTYLKTLMEGLRLIATVKKHTNVLQHIMGYFKNVLSADEKQELLDVISEYHKGLVPLIVPLTLLRHYVRKYDEPYLKRQYYLAPHPAELMLRNHV